MIYEKLDEEELALTEIFRNPVWFGEFIRELEPSSEESEKFEYTEYQKDMLCDFSSFVSLTCARSVGKSLFLTDKMLWLMINRFYDETILFLVPNRVHLQPVFLMLSRKFRFHPLLRYYANSNSINASNFTIKLITGMFLDCRIAGSSNSEAPVSGLHVPFILVDESAFVNFNTFMGTFPVLNTFQKGFQLLVAGTPDGRRERSVNFHCDMVDSTFSKHRVNAHQNPRWTEEDEKNAVDRYGGIESEGYQHSVMGIHGSPVYSMFDRNFMQIENYEMFTDRRKGKEFTENSQFIYTYVSTLPQLPPYYDAVIVGMDLGYCYSSDTDVLTRRGWINHADVTMDDTVACFDTKTDKIRWDKPKFTWQQDYKGKMIEVNGKSTNFMVSPEHTIWTNKTSNKGYLGYEQSKAKDLLNLTKSQRFKVKIAAKSNRKTGPKTFKVPYYYCDRIDRPKIDTTVDMTSWVQFLAWFISEGSTTKGNWSTEITQMKGEYSKLIDELFTKLPYNISRKEYTNQWGKEQIVWGIHCKELYSWLRENCGIGSRNKKIPDFIFNCSTKDLEIFMKTLLMGDGKFKSRLKTNRCPQYCSQSHTLLNQFQHLALMLGYSSTKSYYKDSGGIGTVSLMTRTENQLSKENNVKEIDYDGKIYCLGTTTGYYITRRKGKVAIQGNTEPSVITILYRLKDRFYFHSRLSLYQVDYPIQEKLIDLIDTKYKPVVISIDAGAGGSGKAVIQHLNTDDVYLNKNYKHKVIPVEFGGKTVIGYNDLGEELFVNTKQYAMQKLQSIVNNKDLVFSIQDDDMIGELERTRYTKTESGNIRYSVESFTGKEGRGDDHATASLICGILGWNEKFETSNYLPETKKLLRVFSWWET